MSSHSREGGFAPGERDFAEKDEFQRAMEIKAAMWRASCEALADAQAAGEPIPDSEIIRDGLEFNRAVMRRWLERDRKAIQALSQNQQATRDLFERTPGLAAAALERGLDPMSAVGGERLFESLIGETLSEASVTIWSHGARKGWSPDRSSEDGRCLMSHLCARLLDESPQQQEMAVRALEALWPSCQRFQRSRAEAILQERASSEAMLSEAFEKLQRSYSSFQKQDRASFELQKRRA